MIPLDEVALLKQENSVLRAQIEWLKKQLFGGGKSEKLDRTQLLLKLGELVDGLRLLSVRDSEVVVEKDGQPYVLTMAAPSPVPSKNRGEQ